MPFSADRANAEHSYEASLTHGWVGTGKTAAGEVLSRRRVPEIRQDNHDAATKALHRQAQLGERCADLTERCDDLACRRKQEELARVAGAVLQQRRGRIATGVDLHR